jgi:hypothetical protein
VPCWTRPADGDWLPTRRGTDITAGIPGLGLSGLFVLLSALSLPLAHRGRDTRAVVARLFRLAVIMAAAIILTWEAIVEAYTALHPARPPSAQPAGHAPAGAGPGSWHLPGIGPWHLPIIAISLAIIVLVIATAEALLQLVGVKPTPTPPPVEAALPVEALPGRYEPVLPGRPNFVRGGRYRGEHRARVKGQAARPDTPPAERALARPG